MITQIFILILENIDLGLSPDILLPVNNMKLLVPVGFIENNDWLG